MSNIQFLFKRIQFLQLFINKLHKCNRFPNYQINYIFYFQNANKKAKHLIYH